MFRIVRCCPVLVRLRLYLQEEQEVFLAEKPLFRHLWQLFNRDPAVLTHLCSLKVTSGDHTALDCEFLRRHAVATGWSGLHHSWQTKPNHAGSPDYCVVCDASQQDPAWFGLLRVRWQI